MVITWKSAFSVIRQALAVVKAAGSIPGVSLIPYVGTITAAAGAIEAGLNMAVNVAPYVEAVRDTFSGGLPSQAKLSALNARIAELEAIVAAPLPPREDGEED